MINTLKIRNKRTILDDPESFFRKARSLSEHKQITRVICEELTIEDLENLSKVKEERTPDVKIYNRVLKIPKGFKNQINTTDWIEDCEEDPEILPYIIGYYIQCLEGFSGLFPLSSLTYEIDEEENLIHPSGEVVGTLSDGCFIDLRCPKLLTLDGLYSKTLNPLIDVSKQSKLIPFLVEEQEYYHKTRLLELVPEEVRKVSKEQYLHLIELMTEVLYNSEINTGMIAELRMMAGEVNGR